jgi:chromosome segregation ATPase
MSENTPRRPSHHDDPWSRGFIAGREEAKADMATLRLSLTDAHEAQERAERTSLVQSDQIHSLRANLDAVRRQRNEYMARVNSYKSAVAERDTVERDLRAEVKALRADLEQAERDVAGYRVSKGLLKWANGGMKVTIEDLQEEVDALQTERDGLKAALCAEKSAHVEVRAAYDSYRRVYRNGPQNADDVYAKGYNAALLDVRDHAADLALPRPRVSK